MATVSLATSTDPSNIYESSSGINVTMTSYFSNMTSLATNETSTMADSSATGASIVSPIVMFLAGVIGNILALVVLHKTKTEIRSMMFYTLVAALTWNDLIGICITSPPVLSSYLNQRHMPDKLCRFHAFAMVCFGLSTPLIMCTMAVERSLALKCTYFYSKHCNPSTARIVVGVLWVFVLIFSMLPLFGLGAFKLQYPKTWCFLDFRPTLPLDMAYADTYAIINLLVVAAMFVCNGLVISTLFRVRKTRRMSNASVNSTLLTSETLDEKASRAPQQMRKRHQRDVELHMIYLLCAITTIFSVCWVPLMVYILISVQSPHTHSPVFGLVAVRLASLNQTLNPWIYVILRKTLLSRICRLCQDCVPCREHSEPSLIAPRKLTQYPRLNMKAAQTQERHHNYVHVRHQLCPSSQFVGRKHDAALLEEVQRRMAYSNGGRTSTNGNSSAGGGTSGYRRYCSGTDSEGLRVAGQPCSACRARNVMECEDQEERSSVRHSASTQLESCRREFVCSCLQSPTVSSQVARISSSEVPAAPFLLPTDGIYVDLFRHLPVPEVPASKDSQAESSSTQMPCRPQAGRLEALEGNVSSFVSEVDDHGYSSKVSSDSSRTSTPERIPSDSRLAGIGTHLLKAEELPTTLLSQSAVLSYETAAVAGPKDFSGLDNAGRDNSVDLTSGVFDDLLDDAFDDDIDTRGLREGLEMQTEKKDKKDSSSRSVSCSSASTHVDSSSGREAGTRSRRQLSSSSGH